MHSSLATSEMGTSTSVTGDAAYAGIDAASEPAIGTIWKNPADMPNDGLKVFPKLYRNVDMSKEELIGNIKKAFPLYTRFELIRFVIPTRE